MFDENNTSLLGNVPFPHKRMGRSAGKRIHDLRAARITLKQWRIFQAVYDYGGYTEAGERLYLSQSTVSYAVGRIQEQLGVTLFQIVGRSAVPTPAARAILSHSRYLLRQATELETLARHCAEDQEETVHLLIEQAFPPSALDAAIEALQHGVPPIRTIIETLKSGSLPAALRERPSSLAISSSIPDGFVGEPLTAVHYVALVRMKADEPRPASGEEAAATFDEGCVVASDESALQRLTDGWQCVWMPANAARGARVSEDIRRLARTGTREHCRRFYLVRSGKLTHCAAAVRVAGVLRSSLVL